MSSAPAPVPEAVKRLDLWSEDVPATTGRVFVCGDIRAVLKSHADLLASIEAAEAWITRTGPWEQMDYEALKAQMRAAITAARGVQ